MRIAIIGGGITGLSLAYYLGKEHEITIFDKHIGGLLDAYKINNYFIERYYHHFFTIDSHLIKLIYELGLEKRILWNASRVGFFVNEKIHRFTTPFDLLAFKPLPFADRLRLGKLVLYFKMLRNYNRLVNVSAKNFLLRSVGKNVYNTIWGPLLRVKFGEYADEISAAFVYGRIHPRSQSRRFGKEVVGYLIGSTKVLVDVLVNELRDRGIKFIDKEVKRIGENSVTADKIYKFDKIISTVPTEMFSRLTGIKYNIKYRGVVCMLLRMKKPLSNTYWMNINDKRIPFGGVIEHTNLVPDTYCNNENLAYVFNYTKSNSKIYKMKDDKLFELYAKGLKLMFPRFDKSDVIGYHVSRNKYATPVYNVGYLKPGFETRLRGVYMVNTSQIFPDDRNMNNSIKLAKRFINYFYSKI